MKTKKKKAHGEGYADTLSAQLTALQQAIDGTLSAIREGREQIELIAETTQEETNRLQQESDELQQLCLEAIEKVESLEREEKRAREKLLIVHRDVNKYSEADMQRSYEIAQTIQTDLGQWREREHQYRIRRDDALRRLKALRLTAQRAEVLSLKFGHMTGYLNADFEQFSALLNDAQMQSLLGIQMLQMVETERENLARELHDGPMQTLASTSMRLQVRTAGNDALRSVREEFRGQVNSVIGELRKTIFELRPPLLDDLGIVPALKRYMTQWTETTTIRTYIHLMGLEFSLTPTEKIAVFRCVQEALENVAVHSQAKRVDITVLFKENTIQFTIDDDGIGIPDVNWLAWLQEGKSGLNLCRQRLRLLGAEMNIQNRAHGGNGSGASNGTSGATQHGTQQGNQRGTRIEISVPIVRGEV